MGMARPRKPGSERLAVQAAANSLPDNLSARAKAARIASQAVHAYFHDEKRSDFERLLAEAANRLDPDPIEHLATAQDGIVASKVIAARLERFEARECRQIAPEAWERETTQITETVTASLARRFRAYL